VVVEAVHHQARQQVGITVDQAVARLIEQALAQRQRDLDAMHQQRLVQAVLEIARQQPCADQVVRRHPDDAQRLASGGLENGLVASGEAGQGRGRGVDLVAVDPQMARAQAAVGIGFEAQAGQGHRQGSGKKTGILNERQAARAGSAEKRSPRAATVSLRRTGRRSAPG